MPECIICQKKIGILGKHIEEGHICSECFDCIPTMVDFKSCSASKLWVLIQQNREKRRIFSPSASLGSLYIDSTHKMFCISDKEHKGEPASLADIYTIEELKEISLHCKNPRNVGSANAPQIICDIELYVKTEEMNFHTVIKRNEPCGYKIKDKTKVDWSEPSVLVMFRDMFNQMIRDDSIRLLKRVNALRNSTLIAWAEGVLMLNSEYTRDEMVQHHDILMKHLHPDIDPDISMEYALKVDKAAQILDKHLKQREEENQDQ